jgi:hypothetical protein
MMCAVPGRLTIVRLRSSTSQGKLGPVRRKSQRAVLQSRNQTDLVGTPYPLDKYGVSTL